MKAMVAILIGSFGNFLYKISFFYLLPARHERKGGGGRRLKIILKQYDNAAAFGGISRIITIQMEKIMAASSQKPAPYLHKKGIIPANFLTYQQTVNFFITIL